MISNDLKEYRFSVKESMNKIFLDNVNIAIFEMANGIDNINDYIIENSNEYIMESIKILEEISIKLPKIKIKLTKDNNDYLNKYEKKALENNPIGLSMKVFYIPKNKYVKTCLEESKKVSKINITSKSEMNKYMADFAKKNDITPGTPNMHVAFDIKKNYSITKKDIQNAIKILKNAEKQIKYIESESKKRQEYTKSKLSAIDNNDKLSKEEKNNEKLRLQLSNTFWCAGMITMNNQITIMQKQSRKILVKAAKHNPRNIKESNLYLEEVETLLEEQFDSRLESAPYEEILSILQ